MVSMVLIVEEEPSEHSSRDPASTTAPNIAKRAEVQNWAEVCKNLLFIKCALVRLTVFAVESISIL